MPTTEHTPESMNAYLDRQYYDDADAAGIRTTINRWLERGDGAAIYENQELGHPGLGEARIVSYGSTLAQLEGLPSERLPDIGTSINWRYGLVGTYRGGKL